MLLTKAIESGVPLVVETAAGGTRFAASLFVIPQGVVLFDVGWDTSDGHPIHLVLGDPGAHGPPWVMDGATIRPLTETDLVAQDMLSWDAYLATLDSDLQVKAKAELSSFLQEHGL